MGKWDHIFSVRKKYKWKKGRIWSMLDNNRDCCGETQREVEIGLMIGPGIAT